MIRNLDTIKAKNSFKKIMALNSVQEMLELILKEYKEILPFTETDEDI